MEDLSRWSGRRFHLTYPHTKRVSALELLTHLKDLINVKLKDYLIVTARHNPEGFQIHVYFTTDLEKPPLKKPSIYWVLLEILESLIEISYEIWNLYNVHTFYDLPKKSCFLVLFMIL
jgi:hypothetical protein